MKFDLACLKLPHAQPAGSKQTKVEPPVETCCLIQPQEVSSLPIELTSTVALACLAANASACFISGLAAIALHNSTDRTAKILVISSVSTGVNVASQFITFRIRSLKRRRGYHTKESGVVNGSRYAFWATSITLQALLVVILRGPFRHGNIHSIFLGNVSSEDCMWTVPFFTLISIVAGGIISSLIPFCVRSWWMILQFDAPSGENGIEVAKASAWTLTSVVLFSLCSIIGFETLFLIEADFDVDARTSEEHGLAVFQASTWIIIPMISMCAGVTTLGASMCDAYDVCVAVENYSGAEDHIQLTTFISKFLVRASTVLTDGKYGFQEVSTYSEPCDMNQTGTSLVGKQVLDIVTSISDVVVHGGCAFGATLLAFRI